MRIISEWTKNDIRVSVFHMNGRYSIKLEKDLFEQHYKFRDGQFDSVDDLKSILKEEFYDDCRAIFNSMDTNKRSLKIQCDQTSDFDEII